MIVSARSAHGETSTRGVVHDLVVNGKRVGTVTGPLSSRLAGYGRLIILRTAGNAITGLEATLTKRYKGFPPGSTTTVGYATALATDGKAPPPRSTHTTPPPKPKPARPEGPAAPRAAPRPKKPHAPRRRRPSRPRAILTGKGFVFPVFGAHEFTDTYGAFRAPNRRHQGNDIFAAAGTPVVAVCDGSLNRVGTLPISGNRLWVKCTKGGDSFFYAHLTAFATDTRSGERVTAGQVIGFVGSTGNAEQTPPHCHFEVHPGDGPSVDPYPFLRAWESHRDVPAAAWVRANGELGQQEPGTLVVVKDFLSR
jgi:murein DD-endopeptidase MepM/ murein hydrolase activator NlpD